MGIEAPRLRISIRDRCWGMSFWSVVLASVLLVGWGRLAWAQAGSAPANTVGGALLNLLGVVGPFEILLLGVSFLLGVWLIGTGVMGVATAASRLGGDRGRGYSDAGLRIGLGAAVAALPSALGVGLETLWGKASVVFYGAAPPMVGETQNCLRVSTGALSCVANNIARNVAPVGTFVAVVFSFLAGLVFIAKGLYAFAVRYTDGQPGRATGATTTLIVGVLLANVPFLVESVLVTLGAKSFFGLGRNAYVYTSTLTYVPDSGGILAEQFNSLVRNIFIILTMFGAIAIIRGLIIIKNVSDGKGHMYGRTYGSGATHIIAGALMTNMNWTICVFTNTFLGRVLDFCSI